MVITMWGWQAEVGLEGGYRGGLPVSGEARSADSFQRWVTATVGGTMDGHERCRFSCWPG